jgi:hypothetical protein
MSSYHLSTTLFLRQRRSPGIVRRKLKENGLVLNAGSFLPGVGIATAIICNQKGQYIVEKHLGQKLNWTWTMNNKYE